VLPFRTNVVQEEMMSAQPEPDPPPPATPRTLLDAVGNTPLIELPRLFPGPARVFAKLEYYNPTGSIKDRIARHIISKAEQSGQLKPGGTIVEGTSGNTGAALAAIASARGYRAILAMPSKVSTEKRDAARAYGAEVIVCPSAPPDSPDHYMQKARTIAEATPGAIFINQYNNPWNVEAHYLTTGPEIWQQTQGDIDYFVASASTGGTVSGAGKYLKEQKPGMHVLMPDPIGSIYECYFRTGKIDPATRHPYQLEGVGKDILVECIDFDVIDEVMKLSDKDAFDAASALATQEGILGGGSAGANIWGCMALAQRIRTPKVIVTLIPDSGLKYISKFYNEEWLASADYTRGETDTVTCEAP
jgi:cystathionine beta-synthase/cysteine synthase A